MARYLGNSSHSDPGLTFLDGALNEYGASSVLYISFGSMFFPPPEHLSVLVEAILALEKPTPFLMTTPGAHGHFPEYLEDKIKQSRLGILVSWVDQQSVLSHPATGWMLSHCGAGGTFQALSQGVPIIAWPFAVDQPQHALWVTDVLDAGFYLIQNRTSLAATLKASRGGPAGLRIIGTQQAIRMELDNVLRQAQGFVGAKKRANAQRAGRAIWQYIEPDGKAWNELERLRMYSHEGISTGYLNIVAMQAMV
ncbi:glycosyltransferase family 1 protein [Calocera viscosa TUFC12733]|uniref:Glycosyltransferase family 1 protein n=1 Tax=Calocera viscosa (strain TUFC12733) TaxID=1330018 RepID=A0A167GNV1_CALVF|nr:glycosyltransferase family 1 protein [Calocera viscosa TUFC12733]